MLHVCCMSMLLAQRPYPSNTPWLAVYKYAARCEHIPDEVERTPTIRHFVVTSYLQHSNPTRGFPCQVPDAALDFLAPPIDSNIHASRCAAVGVVIILRKRPACQCSTEDQPET